MKHHEPIDDEWIEDFDEADDDEEELLQCPSCRETVHEETQQCPHCGDWITPIDPESSLKRVVLIFVVVLMVAALLLAITL